MLMTSGSHFAPQGQLLRSSTAHPQNQKKAVGMACGWPGFALGRGFLERNSIVRAREGSVTLIALSMVELRGNPATDKVPVSVLPAHSLSAGGVQCDEAKGRRQKK